MSATAPKDTPQLSRVPGTSLHRQIYMVLLNEIRNGAYAETGALPKEEALCQRFDVSRITVRRALADLAEQGWVERRHGLGTFLRAGVGAPAPVPSLGLLEELRHVAAETQVEVLEVGSRVPPLMVARALGLVPAEKAVHAARVRRVGQIPTMLTEAWIPSAHAKGVTASALKKQALYEVLQAQGVRFGRVVQEFTAVPADPTRARLLQLGVGMPLLKMVRLMHAVDEHVILHISIYLSPEHSRILMDIPADAINTMSAGKVIHR
ncbi:GntR family transcriptional regulator [Aquincola tertiaricarbonis]|uniref:GntR family transcriptional regulator n=1 Tax=Aquincola tertiaricarbonis TaxID=391953 RepID=UPI000614D0F5|nr:GntR family transcriptional regulator [Aquincola tertiaricarbonis]